MRVAKTGYIAVSILLAVLGIVLIAWPTFSVNALGVICGILLILFGGVKLVGYFPRTFTVLPFSMICPSEYFL